MVVMSASVTRLPAEWSEAEVASASIGLNEFKECCYSAYAFIILWFMQKDPLR